MAKATSEPRYIKASTICIGDTIRVTWQHGDIEQSRVGVVAKRDVYRHATDYLTARGLELISVYGDTTANPPGATITLLQRRATDAATLDGIDV